jgi:dihydrofolate reductase
MGAEMGKLINAAIASLDGDVEVEEGRFDWSMPDEEMHAFVNDLERPIGTYLYGRRMYETMLFWETASTEADEPAVFRDCADMPMVGSAQDHPTVPHERDEAQRLSDEVHDAVE